MNWKQAVDPVFAGWPAQERQRAIRELTELNDSAERLGFDCHPDDRLGFGRCYFMNRQHIRVWQSPDGWVRAKETSVAGVFAERELYHTAMQALQARSPFAVVNQYGVRSATRE